MTIYTNVTGEGKDIVLIHGWGCDQRHMQPIADHLAKHYRVTNIDLPGRGLSDWSADIKTIDDIADAILPVLPEKAIYIVHSVGGPIAFSIAARFPERVERVIGIATSPRFVEDSDWPGFPKPGFFAIMGPALEKVGVKTCLKSLYDAEFAEFEPKPEEYKRLMQILETATLGDDHAFAEGVKIVDEEDSREAFSQIQCPIDLILSEQDKTILKAQAEPMKALNAKTNIHMLPGGHLAFLSHPKQFFAVLDAILAA